MIVSPIGEIERPFISSYFLTLLSHKKTFSSFSLSALPNSLFIGIPAETSDLNVVSGIFQPEYR